MYKNRSKLIAASAVYYKMCKELVEGEEYME